MQILFIFTSCFVQVFAGTHSLKYLYIAVTSRDADFPEFTAVGILNGEQFMFYSSSNRQLELKDWIIPVEIDLRSETQDMRGNQDTFNFTFTTVMREFHHTKGVHTLQRMYGCELDDVTSKGYDQYGYDGEDFIGLNLATGTWIAANDKAVITKRKWDSTEFGTKHWKNYLEKECTENLKKFCGKKTLDRKVRPEVSVHQKHSSPSPEVVCHATGFFPKALNITWQNDGEDVHEDVVELRETLPNQDGSFQKRSILKVPADELQKHTYTCVVQHSSLEKELVLNVSKRQILRGGASIAIITAVVAALVAVVAGIVVWKKRNTDFKPVPPEPSSEGDSSSNNNKEKRGEGG